VRIRFSEFYHRFYFLLIDSLVILLNSIDVVDKCLVVSLILVVGILFRESFNKIVDDLLVERGVKYLKEDMSVPQELFANVFNFVSKICQQLSRKYDSIHCHMGSCRLVVKNQNSFTLIFHQNFL